MLRITTDPRDASKPKPSKGFLEALGSGFQGLRLRISELVAVPAIAHQNLSRNPMRHPLEGS